MIKAACIQNLEAVTLYLAAQWLKNTSKGDDVIVLKRDFERF